MGLTTQHKLKEESNTQNRFLLFYVNFNRRGMHIAVTVTAGVRHDRRHSTNTGVAKTCNSLI